MDSATCLKNTESGSRRWLSWAPLAILFAIVLLVDIAIARFVEIRSEAAAGLIIGSAFAQIVAAAVWMSLGPQKWFPRCVAGTIAWGVASLSMFICALRDAGDKSIALVIVSAMLVQCLLYQGPLWMARSRGWRLAWPGAAPTESNASEMQFGLRQLMIWTAIVAAFLAAGRILAGDMLADIDNAEFNDEAVILLIASLFNSLLAFPIIWGCFVRRHLWLWLAIAGIWCVVLTSLELLLIANTKASGNDLEIFAMMNIGQVAAAAGMLLAARVAGFRLTRETAQ